MNINLDYNFDEDDPYTIILSRLLAWHNKLENRETLKRNKLMPIAWHSKTWWNFCMSEDEKN